MSTPISVEAQLNQMERVEPVEPAPTPVVPPDAPPAAPLNVEDEAAVQAALEANAIVPPDGESLHTSSDVGKVAQAYRGKIKELKDKLATVEGGSAKVPQLEQQIAQLQQQVQQLAPYVQAYQQAVQPQTPAAPKEPDIPDHEAEQYARTYDLYKPDGSGQLDLDRGRKIVQDMRRIARETAAQVADERVAPLQQQTISDRSNYLLARARNTVFPNGATVDPAIMDAVASRLPADITSTPEGTQQAMIAALGYTVATMTPAQLLAYAQAAQGRQRGPDGKFIAQQQVLPAPAPIPDPVPREPAGGQPPNTPTQLTEAEQKFLSQTGMSQADYLKVAGGRFGAR
jgi:polyhydroxyalkanoate synthesis regulator phasin